MTVNLSIKNVPEELVERLREMAAGHHRSLQGELMAILERTVMGEEKLSIEQVVNRVEQLGVRTRSESAKLVRAERDAR